MVKRIINIAVFVVGIVSIVLCCMFVVLWNGSVANDASDKEKANVVNYKAVGTLQSFDQGEKFLNQFLSADINAIGSNAKPGKLYNDINAYIEKEQVAYEAEEAQAKDFFCYLNILKSLKKEDFATFKANYPKNMSSLTKDGAGQEFTFGKKYVDDFKAVKTYEDLNTYISEDLSKQYTEFKTAQLTKENELKSVKTLQTATDSIFKVSAFDKQAKEDALAKFQSNFKDYKTMDHNLLSPSFMLIYIMFVIALAAVVIFILVGILSNFKTSYKGLLAFLALIVIALLCYVIASPDVNNAAFTKLSISSSLGRFIEASCYLTYVLVVGALVALIACPVASWIKSKIKLK